MNSLYLNYGYMFTILTLAVIYLPCSTGYYDLNIRSIDCFSKGIRCGKYTIPPDEDERHRHKHRVIGGQAIQAGQFPSFVAILGRLNSGGRLRCSGVLIHNNLVLTSSICINSPHQNPVNVAVGLTTYEGPVTVADQVREVTSICFVGRPLDQSSAGVAVLRLKEPVNYNEKVQPACINMDRSDIANPVMVGPLTRKETEYVPVNYVRLRMCHNVSNVFYEDHPFGSCFQTLSPKETGCPTDDGAGLYVQETVRHTVNNQVEELDRQFTAGILYYFEINKVDEQCPVKGNNYHVAAMFHKIGNDLYDMIGDCVE